MEHTRAQVIAAVGAVFPQGHAATILALLDLYGTESGERERERVQLAIVALSGGNQDKLLDLIQVAKTDYRDVLLWASSGRLSAPEGERLQQAARSIIERWGNN